MRAQDLPDEIVGEIVSRLALSVSSSDSLESPDPSRIWRLLFCCRDWYEPVLRVLQRFVRLKTAKHAIQYLHMLQRDERARSRLVRLECGHSLYPLHPGIISAHSALNGDSLVFANRGEAAAAEALIKILDLCSSIRHLKLGLLHVEQGPALMRALAKQRHLRYFIMQNGLGHREHLRISWAQILELSENWPSCRSLDLFGSSSTTLYSRPRAALPSCLSTIFLADSGCTDDDLDALLAHVPGGLRELGLSWCMRVTPQGLTRIFKKHGKTIRLLTLVAPPRFVGHVTEAPDSDDHAFLDHVVSSLPKLMVLDVEGPWATDRMLERLLPSVRSLVIGRCPRITAAGITMALSIERFLVGLGRLGVVLDQDLGMLWAKGDEQVAAQACARRGIRFETRWSWNESELQEALDSAD